MKTKYMESCMYKFFNVEEFETFKRLISPLLGVYYLADNDEKIVYTRSATSAIDDVLMVLYSFVTNTKHRPKSGLIADRRKEAVRELMDKFNIPGDDEAIHKFLSSQ